VTALPAMPEVRQQIAISDGAVKRPTAAAVLFAVALGVVAAACGPMIEAAPFPVRPDSVRPADLLGPYDGIVVDADSDRAIAGATVAASWAFERGIGLHAPAGAREVLVETGADGRFTVPRLDEFPSGTSARVRRFTLIVYHRGHVAWRNDRLFPSRASRRDFSQRGSRVRLERWQPTFRHSEHVVFLGGGAKVRDVASWELQAAALELEGRQVAGRVDAPGAPATTATPLDIARLLTDEEIRAVTGFVGKFEDGKLTDLPTTEFYDSRHFRAAGKPENYDVGLRVWRLGTAAAEVQFKKLMSTLPDARITDEVGDTSFRAKSGGIAGLVYLVRDRGIVVSMNCGAAQCTEPNQLTKLAKLVESRLAELPPEAGQEPPPSAKPQEEQEEQKKQEEKQP
jgi:hypothetical protein